MSSTTSTVSGAVSQIIDANEGNWTDILWVVIAGALAMFFMGWAIGANDVANAFGTSVGSKAITLWQACLIASVMEFGGAVALGGPVTNTISGGIARPEAFFDVPELFAYGMLCALVAAATWVTAATYYELAVSTTHSIIGAVAGFALVLRGGDSLIWNDSIDEFPYSTGLLPIVASWFISPLCGGVGAAILFVLNRWLILRRKNAAVLAFWSLPPLVCMTVFINTLFVFLKGTDSVLDWSDEKCVWAAAAVAGGATLVTVAGGLPLLKWKLARDEKQAADRDKTAATLDLSAEEGQVQLPQVPEEGAQEGEASSQQEDKGKPSAIRSLAQRYLLQTRAVLMHGMNVDVHEDIGNDATVRALHEGAEVFDAKAENVYSYLQVFSACCMSFAHGANDVANCVGPFAAIWYVYRNWRVATEADSPIWILALGGSGIVCGLSMYGYNIIKALGVKLAKMTPSRGFCCELAAALTISFASVYGLPVSSTHCIVGAEVAVGLTEGIRNGANWALFGKTALSWAFTLIISGFISSVLFAWGAYSPNINNTQKIDEYERLLKSIALNSIVPVNATNVRYGPLLNGTSILANGTVTNTTTAIAHANITFNLDLLFNKEQTGFINQYKLAENVKAALALYSYGSVITVGWNRDRTVYSQDQVVVPRQP